jgi:beta-galactosidase
LVVPRSLHRLERLLHAFGPISAAAFDIMGLGAYDSCLEQGPFAGALFSAERWLRRLLEALGARGIAYRVTGNDAVAHALEASRFGFVASALGLEAELWETLTNIASRGTPLRFGPSLPKSTPDGLQALAQAQSEAAANIAVVSEADLENELDALTRQRPPFQLSAGQGIKASLFRDRDGRGRVLFVTNTTREPKLSRLETAPLNSAAHAAPSEAVDALDGASFRATFGALEVPLSPHSVRMLELK